MLPVNGSLVVIERCATQTSSGPCSDQDTRQLRTSGPQPGCSNWDTASETNEAIVSLDSLVFFPWQLGFRTLQLLCQNGFLEISFVWGKNLLIYGCWWTC